MPRAVLLDVEGTTTPISFVYDVLFPYARTNMGVFLRAHIGNPEVQTQLRLLREAHGAEWQSDAVPPAWNEERKLESAERYALWLMDLDRKSTVLKWLQGRIWTEGYSRKELRSVVFPDVPPALERWHRAGSTVAIFSSGSVLAQKDLFSHTESGDLTNYIDQYFDTAVGAKQLPLSYAHIAATLGDASDNILFVSDVVAELDAALAAGYETRLCLRPGNRLQPHNHEHPLIRGFDDLS